MTMARSPPAGGRCSGGVSDAEVWRVLRQEAWSAAVARKAAHRSEGLVQLAFSMAVVWAFGVLLIRNPA